MHTTYKKLLLALVLMILFHLSWYEFPYLCLYPGQALPIERKLSCPSVVWADFPPVDDEEHTPSPPPPPPDDGSGESPIQRIFQTIMHVINFPTEALEKTLDELIGGYLNGFLEGFQEEVEKLFAHTVLTAPDLEAEPFASAWGSMRTVSMLLWPATLAIIAVLGAQTGSVSNWGLGDLKTEVFGWFVSVLLSFFSLYLCNLFNRLTLGMTEMIMTAGFGAELTVGGLAGVLISGWNFMEIVPEEGGIILALFLLALAVATILSLAFQYIARYTVLFVLVALAPIAITLGTIYQFKWLRWMWLKGFILVSLIGPINALILKLIAAMGLATGGSGFLGTLSGLLITIGLVSILITLDGLLIKTVFSSAIAIAEQFWGAMKAFGTVALAAGTGFLGAGAVGGTALAGATAGGFGEGSAVPGGGGAAPLGGGGGGSAPTTSSGGGRGGGTSASPTSSTGGATSEEMTGPGAGGMQMRQALREDAEMQAQQAQQQGRIASGLSRAGSMLRGGFRPGSVGSIIGEGLRQAGEAMRPEGLSSSAQARPSSMSELQGMTARLGYSPLSPQGRQITGALALMEGHYGPEAVRRAAPQAMAPMIAARQDSLPIQDMAQEEGFSDAGAFVGGLIEDQIEANGNAGDKDRLFHRDAGLSSAGNPPHGLAPSWYDYKSGWAMAEAQGTPDYGHAQMYAALHHAFRAPQYGGNTRGNELFRAASETRDRVAPGRGALAPPVAQQVHQEFSQWVNEQQSELGIPDSHLPQRWLQAREA